MFTLSYLPHQIFIFGPLYNLKRLLLVLCFLIYPTDLGNSKAHRKCSQWVGSCVKCSRLRSWTEGIFCANYYNSLGTYPPCGKMWCGKCYTSEKNLHFHVASLANQNSRLGSVKDQVERERLEGMWHSKHQSPTDFHVARDGDHLLVLFECVLCIFRKLRKENPDI